MVVTSAATVWAAPAASAMTRGEVASLKYASQQEKLGRDLYRAFDRRWNMAVFSTLARSDNQQLSAVRAVMSRYRIADPTAGRRDGSFADPAFTHLYQNAVRQGEWSRWDARNVAIRIESEQIRRVRARFLSAANPDLRRLLAQLTQVATTHLHTLQHWEGQDDGDNSDHGQRGDR